ncbi:MAG: hypothetical protein WKG07_25110 [Hymenobacter sp.]
MKQYGWYRGDELSRYLSELVARKTQRPDLTLGELHALALAQPGRYRDLYTTGTNLTTQRSQVFSYETGPTGVAQDTVMKRIANRANIFIFGPLQGGLSGSSCVASARSRGRGYFFFSQVRRVVVRVVGAIIFPERVAEQRAVCA